VKKGGCQSLKKQIRVAIFVCVAALGLLALALAVIIYQGTPFFNMNLVALEVLVILLMAILYVTALMAHPS
jgi:hypothetical protein